MSEAAKPYILYLQEDWLISVVVVVVVDFFYIF